MGVKGRGPDPHCSICSKPIREGFIVLEHGEVLHLRCRSNMLGLAAMEQMARSRAASDRAARLIEAADRAQRQARMLVGVAGPCPLCGLPALVQDSRPRVRWVVVHACPCDGFFMDGRLFDTRMPTLSAVDRENLLVRVRQFRTAGWDAWCVTTDGTVGGPLVVQTEWPDYLT